MKTLGDIIDRLLSILFTCYNMGCFVVGQNVVNGSKGGERLVIRGSAVH